MADGFRIAFCIECHKYTPVLQELCRQLQHPEADIFIHVDAKSDIGDFAPLRPLARFIHPRSKVYWGEYGQIDCMLKLLRATCNGDYRYIAILSGDTLPATPLRADTRFPRSVLPAAVRGHAARTAHHRADAEDAVVPLPRQERLDRAPAGLFPQKALQTAAPRGQPLFQDIAAARKGFQLDRRHRPLPGFCVRLSAHPPRLYPRIQTLALRRRDLFPDPDGHFRIRRCEYAPSPRLHPMGRRRGAHPETFGTNDLPGCCRHGTRRRKFRTSSPARSPTTWTSPATGRPSFPGRNSAGFARHAKNAIFAAPETASDF